MNSERSIAGTPATPLYPVMDTVYPSLVFFVEYSS